ncbi:hypothetical protein LTR53_000189 [Teratosphaeriaceae sp. CCFEE 6253]|nr:hypothetical protein LTR53_000189 [Teratosphaeriaceae sp. CCFEE 6253]
MKCDEVQRGRECVYGPPSDSNAGPPAAEPPSLATPHLSEDRPSRTSLSADLESRPPTQPWPEAPLGEGPSQNISPLSSYSASTAYGTEVAPLRWFGLLAGDSASVGLDVPEHPVEPVLNGRHRPRFDGGADLALSAAQRPGGFGELIGLQTPSRSLQTSSLTPGTPSGGSGDPDEPQVWQSAGPILLKDHERDVFKHFVTGALSSTPLHQPV